MANPKETVDGISRYLLRQAGTHFAKAAVLAQSGDESGIEKEAQTANAIVARARVLPKLWQRFASRLEKLGLQIPDLNELFPQVEQPASAAPEVPPKINPGETVLDVPTPERPKPTKI